jgi:signal transduction histidine kinase
VGISVLVAASAVPAIVFAPLAWLWPLPLLAAAGYVAGRRIADPPTAMPAIVVLAALPVFVFIGDLANGLYDWFVYALLMLVSVMVPWLAGRFRRQRAELTVAGWERAALLERQRQLQISQERARIAREMHDSLGHEWGLLALRAAALEVARELPEQHREMVGELRAGVAHATERLREIVGMLDSTQEPGDVAGLVERARAAGMDVTAEQPDGLPVAAYRVVQEGLTNAAKHAPGAPVTIRFDVHAASTGITITNGPGAPGNAVSGGTGLARLKEAVQLKAGPTDDGGFQLMATIPHTALPEARDAARHNLARVVKVPAIAGAVIVALTAVLYFVAGANNRLDPAAFDRIHVGMAQHEVEHQLPAFQILGDPDPNLPAPQGAECRRYWATEQRDDRLYFRLCFAGGQLVSKQTVPRKDIQ